MVAEAELPPLTVMLGPGLPLLPVLGASEVAGANSVGEAVGDEVAGAVLTSVVTVLLVSAPVSSLLQPDSRATVTAAEDTVKTAVR